MTGEKLQRIKEIANSNEFWGMSSGEHLNVIDSLLDEVEHLKRENERLRKELNLVKAKSELPEEPVDYIPIDALYEINIVAERALSDDE